MSKETFEVGDITIESYGESFGRSVYAIRIATLIDHKRNNFGAEEVTFITICDNHSAVPVVYRPLNIEEALTNYYVSLVV